MMIHSSCPPCIHKECSSLSEFSGIKSKFICMAECQGIQKISKSLLKFCFHAKIECAQRASEQGHLIQGDSFWQGAEERVGNVRVEDSKTSFLSTSAISKKFLPGLFQTLCGTRPDLAVLFLLYCLVQFEELQLHPFSRIYFSFHNYLSICQFWIVISRKLLIQTCAAIHQVKDMDEKSIQKIV